MVRGPSAARACLVILAPGRRESASEGIERVPETQRIVLIGLSGTGKSSVGRAVAEQLDWSLVDTDDEISRAFGTTIADIFALHGESAFRAAERRILASALDRPHVVVACGGGAVIAPDVWSAELLRRPGTLVVTLDADPRTSLDRLRTQQQAEGDAAARPLLAAADPLPRIVAMKADRQAIYDRGDITLINENVRVEELAAEIAWLTRFPLDPHTPTLTLSAPSGDSSIHIAPGALARLGSLCRRAYPHARRAWLITDSVVGPLHAAAATAALANAGVAVEHHVVPAGEASKSLAEASRAYDWLLARNVERSDVVIALGGGVSGDLAGFIAATVLRGIGLVQVPTSLLAMVDSSVGGKTGIDHPAGKNLIGAFYQPRLVVIDPDVLTTLPDRQVANGMAEVIKHAIIQPSTPGGERRDLLRFHERNEAQLRSTSGVALPYLIRRNVALKAAVVAADEREAAGRAYLNFGHTLGHAVEAANYALLHGEAIAVGMRGEALIGAMMGTCGDETVATIGQLTGQAGLPASTTAPHQSVIQLLHSDKKRAAGKIRWVLPLAGGGVTIRDDVPLATVQAALEAVTPATL